MSDIKKDIAKDFRELTSRNAKIKELSKKLEAGKASYLDADSLALELATALGKALHNNLGNDQLVGEDYKALMREVLPAGLHDIYEDVADYAVTIQRGIYLRQNIGLRVAPPDFNTVEVDEITGKATMVNSYKEIPGGLTNDIQHMAQNVATDTMDKNARLARDVGYEPVVTRVYDRVGVHTQNGGKYRKDCQWCLSRCGTDVPYGEAKSRDMFRRHPGCKCRIEYTVNGKTQVQTDWRRNQWANTTRNGSITLAKDNANGIIKTGGIVGALNDKNDPWYERRAAHAARYYESVRNSKKDGIVSIISANSGVEKERVSQMFDHIFVNEYDLEEGKRHFDPSYDIAESIRRLREGTHIQKHDITLIYHESEEYKLMTEKGLGYEEAHNMVNERHNYSKELDEWKRSNER